MGEENHGEPRTELQELQFQADQKTDETLESTRKMMLLCEEVKSLPREIWHCAALVIMVALSYVI